MRLETDSGSRWSTRGRNGEVERLTGVLEGVDLQVQQRKGLSEAIRYRGLLLLKDLCHLEEGRGEGEEQRR